MYELSRQFIERLLEHKLLRLLATFFVGAVKRYLCRILEGLLQQRLKMLQVSLRQIVSKFDESFVLWWPLHVTSSSIYFCKIQNLNRALTVYMISFGAIISSWILESALLSLQRSNADAVLGLLRMRSPSELKLFRFFCNRNIQ